MIPNQKRNDRQKKKIFRPKKFDILKPIINHWFASFRLCSVNIFSELLIYVFSYSFSIYRTASSIIIFAESNSSLSGWYLANFTKSARYKTSEIFLYFDLYKYKAHQQSSKTLELVLLHQAVNVLLML